jgi:endogenous inhibitor of DNA gyrase (YacG/DUF329 family)
MTETTKVKLLKIKCPRCGTVADWKGNPDRPFCSPRCRLIDLGRWAEESYRIPAGNAPPGEEEAESPSHREDEE